jgi:phosphopantothenoylcysteine synthetase/decarboxylase
MWRHPATQANVGILVGRGAGVVGPGDGPLACGYEGPGRLADTPEILAAAKRLLGAR